MKTFIYLILIYLLSHQSSYAQIKHKYLNDTTNSLNAQKEFLFLEKTKVYLRYGINLNQYNWKNNAVNYHINKSIKYNLNSRDNKIVGYSCLVLGSAILYHIRKDEIYLKDKDITFGSKFGLAIFTPLISNYFITKANKNKNLFKKELLEALNYNVLQKNQ